MAKTANHVGRRYAVIIGPGPHWFHELQRSWFEQRSQIHTITRCSAHCTYSEQNNVCALLFTLFSAQFLVHFLSDGGDHGLRVRVISNYRYCCGSMALMFCLLVTS